MSHYIDIIGTEAYYQYWNVNSPSTHGTNCRNFCLDVWETEIDDGSYNYVPTITYWDKSDVEIPGSELCDSPGCSSNCCPLGDRRKDARDWLKANWNNYDTSTAIVVLDLYGEGGSMGLGPHGEAGKTDKVGIVDTWWHNEGRLDTGFHSDTKSQGITQHELGHLYTATHRRGYTYYDGDVTLMTVGTTETDKCASNSSREKRQKDNSSCNNIRIRSHIDNTSSIS